MYGKIAASLAFTQPSYRRGDLARAVLTLHNTSAVQLTDVGAECSVYLRSGSVHADVGELSPKGPGVVLAAGARREVAVTVPVTDTMAAAGHLRLSCSIGTPPTANPVGSLISALARVPGGTAPRVNGNVVLVQGQNPLGQPSGDPLPGVKIYLRDAISQAVVARDVTDTKGHYTFRTVPAGLYDVGLVGPWRLYGGEEIIALAGEDGLPEHPVYVVPGPYQADPDTAPPAGAEPVPAPGSGQPPLAATGSGVTRLALSGLLTLLIGAGLVLVARRGPDDPGSRRT